ncbi:MAG: VWA domain-containing protein [Phycisphaerae bacterium]
MARREEKVNYVSLSITLALHVVMLVCFALIQFSGGGLGKLLNNPAIVAVRNMEVFNLSDFIVSTPKIKRSGYNPSELGGSKYSLGGSFERNDGTGSGLGSSLGELLGIGNSGGLEGAGTGTGAGSGAGDTSGQGMGQNTGAGAAGSSGQGGEGGGTGTGAGTGAQGSGSGSGTEGSGTGAGAAGTGNGGGAGAGSGGGQRQDGSYNISGPKVSGFVADIESATEERPETRSHQITFFGNVASARKVCFVVDCSGSMLGFFGEVQTKLTEVISQLKQDNFYGVIVFRGSDILELKKEQLIRASDNGRAAGIEMISKIPMPMGRPDALEAIKAAIRYKDSIGDHAGVIYFLTDGFDYAGFAEEVESYRKEYAPAVKIHTIGFRTNTRDARMLQRMAEYSGGEFTLYSEGVN